MASSPDERPLAGYARSGAVDIDAFRMHAAQLLTPHRIKVGTTGSFRGEIRAARVGDLQIIYLEQGVDIDVDILEPIDYYDAMFAVRGSSRIDAVGDRRGIIDRTHGALLSPGMRATMRMDAEYAQLHLRIERATLDRRLESVLNRQVDVPALFDVPLDLERPQVATWFGALRLALTDLDLGGGLLSHSLSAASWQDLLLTGLIDAQTHSYSSDLDDRRSAPVHRRLVRKAIEYCEAHVADPISLVEMAEHVGATPRSLQRAFRADLGTSPTEYLQTLRLEHAHRELSSMRIELDDSVTTVAYRWGFTHLSRFAAMYRKRYGELPSQTRRRALGA